MLVRSVQQPTILLRLPSLLSVNVFSCTLRESVSDSLGSMKETGRFYGVQNDYCPFY